METACLRIKFTPFFQEAQKNTSQCCLEIVPEVSCIQNLDKLTWKQQSNYIEYTIPMTYKIILRRRNSVNDKNNEIAKSYHSCVDLLLSSSNLDLAPDDVSKIISDTMIINKIHPTLTKQDLTTVKRHSSEVVQSFTATDTVLEIIGSTEKVEEDVSNDDEIELEPLEYKVECVEKVSCDKPTNTENNFTIFATDIQSEWPAKISGKPESKRKLSVTPICSINTQENACLVNKLTKAVTCKIYDSQKDLVPLGCISTLSDFTKENQPSNVISSGDWISGQSSIRSVHFSHSDRSPELRIAQFVQYMERELSPLTLSLDELITKCTVLGVCKVPPETNDSAMLLYKSVCMYNSNPKIETCEKSISNRAVYSIVFDG